MTKVVTHLHWGMDACYVIFTEWEDPYRNIIHLKQKHVLFHELYEFEEFFFEEISSIGMYSLRLPGIAAQVGMRSEDLK